MNHSEALKKDHNAQYVKKETIKYFIFIIIRLSVVLFTCSFFLYRSTTEFTNVTFRRTLMPLYVFEYEYENLVRQSFIYLLLKKKKLIFFKIEIRIRCERTSTNFDFLYKFIKWIFILIFRQFSATIFRRQSGRCFGDRPDLRMDSIVPAIIDVFTGTSFWYLKKYNL